MTLTSTPRLDRLEEAGCIAGPIAELPEVCADPQLRANGAFQKVSHPVAGDFETVGAPFNIHGADVRVRGPGPEPGADTEAVLAEHLGMDRARAKALVEAGVLGYRPLEGSPLANWTSKL
jgi:crotonobetainyl-CoA:carnitine CoA-transferase CaiB-like acyl-CoA transferase